MNTERSVLATSRWHPRAAVFAVVQRSPHGHRQLLSSTTGNAPPIQAALHSPSPAPECSIPSLHPRGLVNQQSPCFDQSHSTWCELVESKRPCVQHGLPLPQRLQHLKYLPPEQLSFSVLHHLVLPSHRSWGSGCTCLWLPADSVPSSSSFPVLVCSDDS